VNTIGSVGVAYIGKTALKAMIKEERPDHSDNKSFPSGHAAIAFAAARSIDKEFRKESIWIPIAGYAAATAIGVERVASDRHHWYDVAAGAALGIGSAELTWLLSDKLFPEAKNHVAIGCSGNAVDVAVSF
jgi:membrane-associated phospholipid phosphatase